MAKLTREDVLLSALEIEGVFMADTDEHWSVASVGMAVARAQALKVVKKLKTRLAERPKRVVSVEIWVQWCLAELEEALK